MCLSKIDIAEAQLRTAICLFFENAHPVPVHTLAGAAREILTTLGHKLKIPTFVDDLARWRGVPFKKELAKATQYVNFLKHADRDPGVVLEGFSDLDNDVLLFCASRNLGKIAKGLPIECQVYEAWFFATHVERVSIGGIRWQEKVRKCIRLFPGIRSVPREQQKSLGLTVLSEALQNPHLNMKIDRVVRLPEH